MGGFLPTRYLDEYSRRPDPRVEQARSSMRLSNPYTVRRAIESPVSTGAIAPESPAGRVVQGAGEAAGMFENLIPALAGTADYYTKELPARALGWAMTDPNASNTGGGSSSMAGNIPQKQGVVAAAENRAEAEAAAAREEALGEAQDYSISSVLNARDQNQAAATAETDRRSVRAFRMPGGKVVFTNQPGVYAGGGGQSTDEYGAASSVGSSPAPSGPISLQPDRGDFSPKLYGGTSEGSEGLRRLTANSAAVRARQAAGGTGRGRTFSDADIVGAGRPGVSQSGGTVQQQRELQLEDASQLIALAAAGQQYNQAKMSPEQLAELNPATATAKFLERTYGPQTSKAIDDAQFKIRMVSTPGAPDFIPDVKQREDQVRQIIAERDAQIQAIQARQAVAAGTTTPRQF